jgi:hypothetical protein
MGWNNSKQWIAWLRNNRDGGMIFSVEHTVEEAAKAKVYSWLKAQKPDDGWRLTLWGASQPLP